MAQLVLGAAAIGLPYGFSPTGERTLMSEAAAQAVFDSASALDWLAVDTAPAYGCSEDRVGTGWKGPIWTKVTGTDIHASVRDSLRRLGCERVSLIQWHNWVATMADDEAFTAAYEYLRTGSATASVGATTYGPTDAAAAAAFGFDWVQLEANILNAGSLAAAFAAKKPHTRIAVRSALLQGVLTERSATDLPDYLAPLAGNLAGLRQLAAELGESLTGLALRALLHDSRVDAVLVGADAPEHVEFATRCQARGPLPASAQARLNELEARNHPATDPRTWSS